MSAVVSPVVEAAARFRAIEAGENPLLIYGAVHEDNTKKYQEDCKILARAFINKNLDRALAFIPPTLEEVREFVAKQGFQFDPEQFVAFYAAKGWKIGSSKMKDWRAACRTWHRKQSAAKPLTKLQRMKRELMS